MARIKLTRGKSATVDQADAKRLGKSNWYAGRIGKTDYAMRKVPKEGGGQRTVYMHRVVKPAKAGKLVHHVGSHGLNDRRAALRVTGQAGNQRGVKQVRKGAGRGKG